MPLKTNGGKNGAVLPALFQHMSHMYRIQDQHPHHRTKTKWSQQDGSED